jgi:hypothetical protein
MYQHGFMSWSRHVAFNRYVSKMHYYIHQNGLSVVVGNRWVATVVTRTANFFASNCCAGHIQASFSYRNSIRIDKLWEWDTWQRHEIVSTNTRACALDNFFSREQSVYSACLFKFSVIKHSRNWKFSDVVQLYWMVWLVVSACSSCSSSSSSWCSC